MEIPAKTLSEAKLILDRERPELDPASPADKKLYVERGNDTIDDLITEARSAVASNRPFRWFFTGHTGAGKSTELNRFINSKDLRQDYLPISLSVREVLDVHDLDFADLVLGYAVSVARIAEINSVEIPRELQERIEKWGTETELERELGGTASVKGGYEFNAIFWKASAEIQTGGEMRRTVREKIRESLTQFIGLINGLVDTIQKKTDRRILIVVDTLDHVDHRPVREIYTNHWSTLSKPNVSVLTVVPLPMLWESRFIGLIQSNCTLLRNVKVYEQPGSTETDSGGLLFFADLIKRLADIKLFHGEATKELFRMSGGILRDMIGYSGDACKVADRRGATRVELEDVQRVFEGEKARFRRLLKQSDYELLQEVAEGPYPRNVAELGALVHLKAILYYPNGEGWYGVNPAVQAILDE